MVGESERWIVWLFEFVEWYFVGLLVSVGRIGEMWYWVGIDWWICVGIGIVVGVVGCI